jgi:leucyl aminopeptidase
LKSYHFDKYKTKKDNSDSDDQDETNFEQLIIAMDGADQAADEWPKTRAVAEGVYFARDLVTEPPNRLTPASYADRVVEKFGPTDATVTVLDEDELNDLGFNAHLAVGMGSDNPSRLVIIEHHGGNSGDAPLAFVGKGITFDTGGISLKPSKGMWDMKYDMGGSASVVGAMLSLVKRSAPVNAIGVIGLAENMPSARAQRPSDVVKSYSGQTIEVLNTDAEGRLVLSDCLYYTQEKYNPAIMIDFATLTGSAVVALGHEHAALYSENDGLIKGLRTAGSKTWDRVWQMPLDKNYDQLMDSDIADIKNINTKGKAGSITAAQFLKRFTNDHKGWAHLDIAGVAWTDSAKNSHPKGATGFGVRLLDQYVRDHHG